MSSQSLKWEDSGGGVDTLNAGKSGLNPLCIPSMLSPCPYSEVLFLLQFFKGSSLLVCFFPLLQCLPTTVPI